MRERGREAMQKPTLGQSGDGRGSQDEWRNRCKVREQGFDTLRGKQYIWELTEHVERS